MAFFGALVPLRLPLILGYFLLSLGLATSLVWAQGQGARRSEGQQPRGLQRQERAVSRSDPPRQRIVGEAINPVGAGRIDPWDPNGVFGGRAQYRRPLTLSGTVILEDGSQPPGEARIELVCGGEIQPQAITNRNGSFVFRAGGDKSFEIVTSSADRSQPLLPANGSEINMSDCEIRAALGGYRSSRVQLGLRSIFQSPEIGKIILYPMDQPLKPSLNRLDSVVAWNRYRNGQKELLKEKPDAQKAGQELERAVSNDPEFAAAWNLLAEARIRMSDLNGARQALERAIHVDPGYLTPCLTLALLELKSGRIREAAVASERAISIEPNSAEASYYHGIAFAELGYLERARTSLERVLRSSASVHFPRAHYLLGVISAQSGELTEAILYYHRYLRLESDSKAAAAVKQQLDQWEVSGFTAHATTNRGNETRN